MKGPAYEIYDPEAPEPSRWNPKNWPTWGKWTAGIAVVLVVAAAVVGGVLGARANKYPDYTKLTYSLVDTYSGTDFFDNFDYYTETDPSDGYVTYVSSSIADSSSYNLTYASSSSAVLRVDTSTSDTTTTASTGSMGGPGSTTTSTSTTSSGRNSVRITSKNTYNDGLFVFDILHAPYGCGTWPALWLTDPNNWPEHGEIDVMETVNQAASGNQMTLHTSEGCTMGVKRKESGTVSETNCYEGADDNAGCGVKGPDDTAGAAFNDNNGGVYAMELRDAGIRVWFWKRSSIPDDLDSDSDSSPNPEGWGEALADFPSTDCDISTHFKNQSIIANIDLCGSWAGATSVYTNEDSCPDTCETYVATNGTAFDEAYWEFKSFRVYQSS